MSDIPPDKYEKAKERARGELSLTELTNMLHGLRHVHGVLVDGEEESFRQTTVTVGFDKDGYRSTRVVGIIMRRQGWMFQEAIFEPYNRLRFVEVSDDDE